MKTKWQDTTVLWNNRHTNKEDCNRRTAVEQSTETTTVGLKLVLRDCNDALNYIAIQRYKHTKEMDIFSPRRIL